MPKPPPKLRIRAPPTVPDIHFDGEEPIALDLNVDAALVLRDLVGIDDYPLVLALYPVIPDPEDAARVAKFVSEQLVDAHILVDDTVHPRVAEWLRCLDRPDMELAVRIIECGDDEREPSMLRMALVRQAGNHVLAVRYEDHIVVQPVFHEGKGLGVVSAALRAALGPSDPLPIEQFSAPREALRELPTDPQEYRRAIRELGATAKTANVLGRPAEEMVRRAEVIMIEHRDGGAGSVQTPASLAVLDTLSGRVVVTPSVALDGQVRQTYRPGDDAAVHAGIAALVELLPGRSWFDTARTDQN